MIALIQRVNYARVESEGELLGEIGMGLLLLLGVEQGDTPEKADKLLKKVLNYRVFTDENQKMNLNLCQVGGSLLTVSQFTLAADTQSGTRPSFSSAAAPELAQSLYQYFCEQAAQIVPHAQGRFAAKMQISLQNDGPVTFWLQV